MRICACTHIYVTLGWQVSSTGCRGVGLANFVQRVKIVINDNIIEQVTDFKYLGYRISEYKSDLEDKLQNLLQNKRSNMETFCKTNEQRNKVKNSQHHS